MNKGNADVDFRESTSILKHSTLTSSIENVPQGEFILWGYKIIENENQSRHSMLMPIYRVISSDYSKDGLSLIDCHQCDKLPSPSLSHSSSLPSAPTFTRSVSPSLTASPIPIQSVPPLQSSHISVDTSGNNDYCVKQNHQAMNTENQKVSRQQYSPEVTKCLKQAFVETIGQDRKLTKDLRKKIMYKTGLNSRSLTYWFSNRKRRPPFLAQQFKESVKQSRGQVKTYEDFELWWALSKKKK